MINERWQEIKENSHHTCSCEYCTIAIQIANKSILHVLRETSAIETDRFIAGIVDPSYEELKKKET